MSKKAFSEALEIIGAENVKYTQKKRVPGCGMVMYFYNANNVSVAHMLKGKGCMELIVK
ncbi:MAG: hypothetical protein R3279_06450 [Putridiphycobacter sp.]|nr:hypothetical protein [Putridiphycobacter sp.]